MASWRILLLYFAIVCSLCTSSLAIRELLPPVELLFSSASCSSAKLSSFDSFIIPFGSSFQFNCKHICTTDKNKVQLKFLWLYQPDNELKVIPIPGTEKKNYTVTENGTLEVLQIESNGTWYCKEKNHIYATYSVTTSKNIFTPTNDTNKNTPSEKMVNDVVFTHTTKGVFKTDCSHRMGKIGFKRTIHQHLVSANFSGANEDEMDLSMFELKLKFERFGHLSIHDFTIFKNSAVKEAFSSISPVKYIYELCNIISKDSDSHLTPSDKFRKHQEIAKNQFFSTKFRPLHSEAIISCAFRGVKEYHWKKIKVKEGKDMTNHSQWLSPLFLNAKSNDKVSIDFLNNLKIKLDLEDYTYRYVCYYDKKPIASFMFKFNADSNFLIGYLFGWLPSLDLMTIICVGLSAGFIVFVILGNPDIDSKL